MEGRGGSAKGAPSRKGGGIKWHGESACPVILIFFYKKKFFLPPDIIAHQHLLAGNGIAFRPSPGSKQENGEYDGGPAPYGFAFADGRKTVFVVDEKPAGGVRGAENFPLQKVFRADNAFIHRTAGFIICFPCP